MLDSKKFHDYVESLDQAKLQELFKKFTFNENPSRNQTKRPADLPVEVEILEEFESTPEDCSSVARIKIKGHQVQKEMKLDCMFVEKFKQQISVKSYSHDGLVYIDGSQFINKLPHMSEGKMIILTFKNGQFIRASFKQYDDINKNVLVFENQKACNYLDDYNDDYDCDADDNDENFKKIIGNAEMSSTCGFELCNSNIPNNRKIQATKLVLNQAQLKRCLSPEVVREPVQLEPLIPGLDELTSDNIICYQEQLTKEQRQAVIDILKANNRPYPYILFGPPGTGKTAVLTELVVQIYKLSSEATILIVSDANISADSITAKIASSGQIKDDHMIRFVSSTKYKKTQVDCRKYHPRSLINIQVMPRIVVATCNMTYLLTQNGQDFKFDFVIVDEAGHAQEPDVLIPITLVKDKGSIVLAGDPYQLSPLVLHSDLRDLEESILDRLFKIDLYRKDNGLPYNRKYITKLLQCHRSDPRLFRVNNNRFYDGELKSSYKSDANILNILQTTDPMIFDQIRGNQQQRGTSYINIEQAARCVDYVRHLYDSRISHDDIGIICGYQPQVMIVLKEFKSRSMKVCKVATIDGFQGEERKVIIICTVRSSAGYSENRGSFGLGFLRDSKRFNVATTRARDATIVVGDSEILNKSWDWKDFIYNASKSPTNLAR